MQNKHSRIVSAAAEQGEDKMRITLPEPFGLFERSVGAIVKPRLVLNKLLSP